MRPVTVMLSDPEHRFPVPDKPGLFLEKDDRLTIDADDPSWINLIDDGSVMIVVSPDVTSETKSAKTAPKGE